MKSNGSGMRKVIMKAFAFAMTAVLAPALASAYTVDGLMSDWGVSLYSDWTPNSGAAWVGGVAGDGVLAPGDVAYEVNRGGVGNAKSLANFGGKKYDAEAAYFDQDASKIYFAVVTSFPQSGVAYPDGNDGLIHTGDIAISLGGGVYQFGIRTESGGTFGNIYHSPTWSLPDSGVGFPANTPSKLSGGTLVGGIGSGIQLVYFNSGIADPAYPSFKTYVIEGSVDKSVLGVTGSSSYAIHWTESCGNDEVEVASNPVPEPASLLLLSTGFLVLLALKKLQLARLEASALCE